MIPLTLVLQGVSRLEILVWALYGGAMLALAVAGIAAIILVWRLRRFLFRLYFRSK